MTENPGVQPFTFLFTDIEGSTLLWERHPQAMKAALARHDALLRQAFTAHDGRVFKTLGDAFCVVFAFASQAIRAAVAGQSALEAEPWGEIGALRVRMALHSGAADERDNDYFGPALNRVQRLLSAAHGGQILLSHACKTAAEASLPAEIGLRDLGRHRFKGLPQPEEAYQVLAPGLPTDFPPLRSLEALTHNLPAQLTSFIGRENEIGEVKRLLATNRLLTLSGVGGTGKTRLALQVASESLETFGDGVWLIELAALADPALISLVIIKTLGISEEPHRSPLATLTDYLRNRRALIILDNCEHLIQACAQLAGALLQACAQLRLMATSREALGIPGEATFYVPSLSLPPLAPEYSPTVESVMQYEAVRLFVERAKVAQANFNVTHNNAAAVLQICMRLDGIPLAIELAAARVRSLPVEQIATRMNDRFRLLTGGSRTALPRQQTLQALIDWSYDLLAAPERLLLQRLSVFNGGCTLEATEAICSSDDDPDGGIAPFDVLDLLTRLVDKSLVLVEVTHNTTRYRMLETIRQYGREKLLASGNMPLVRARHLQYYAQLAEQAAPELWRSQQHKWLDCLELERDNLRIALEWSDSGDRAEIQLGLRLAVAIGWFWLVRGYWREGREWLARLLARLDPADESTLHAQALNLAGLMTAKQDQHPEAIRAHEQSLEMSRRHGYQLEKAYALHGIASIGWQRGDPATAASKSQESLVLFKELNDGPGIALALGNLGGAALLRQELVQATAYFEESLAVCQQMGHQLGAAGSYMSLGYTVWFQGNLPRARTLFEQALAIFWEADDRSGILETLGGLAAVCIENRDPLAVPLLQERLTLARQIGHLLYIGNSLLGLGVALSIQGNDGQAKEYYQQALATFLETGSLWQASIVQANLGFSERDQGNHIAARQYYQAAISSSLKSYNWGPMLFAKIGLMALGMPDQPGAIQTGKIRECARLLLAMAPLHLRNITLLDPISYEYHLAWVRQQLGETEFEAARAANQTMSWNELYLATEAL